MWQIHKGLYKDDVKPDLNNSIKKFLYREELVCKAVEEQVAHNISRHKLSVFKGTASFKDEHHILIEGIKEELIRAEKIIIATGSYPVHPDNIPFDLERIHDSDSILSIKHFPKSICIVGAGVIGCEYATIFASLGIPVYLINKQNQILGFLDKEISGELVSQMKKQGVDIIFESEVEELRKPKSSKEALDIKLSSGETLHVDMFLFAAGRSGNTKALNCANAGIKLGKREAIEVNEHYQSSTPHIYAVGDVIGFPALAS